MSDVEAEMPTYVYDSLPEHGDILLSRLAEDLEETSESILDILEWIADVEAAEFTIDGDMISVTAKDEAAFVNTRMWFD